MEENEFATQLKWVYIPKKHLFFLFCDWDSAYSQGLVFTKAHFTLWICGWEYTFFHITKISIENFSFF